jgi:hypothetical protein
LSKKITLFVTEKEKNRKNISRFKNISSCLWFNYLQNLAFANKYVINKTAANVQKSNIKRRFQDEEGLKCHD